MVKPLSILVPVSGEPASLAAVRVACAAARPKKGRVHVVHVIEVERALPLNADKGADARRGEQVLRRANDVAGAADYHVSSELIQARDAGQAIVDEANEKEFDVIVLGVSAVPPVGEAQVGRTAEYVLKNAGAEVWLIREPIARLAGALR